MHAAIVRMTQPVYVMREEKNSRESTIAEIRRRAVSREDASPQTIIFPEATCSSHTALVTFKLGLTCYLGQVG